MLIPTFTWDDEANGYISEAFTVNRKAMAHIELKRKAPVVTLRMEEDGGYATYGVIPEESDRYEINLTTKSIETLKLASPVEVTKCYVIN